jgi:putative nucleotidyltransferase-like protein
MAQALLHAPDDIRAADVYRSVLWHLREAGIPYLVGGTYALEHHAGLVRDTKDLDLFVRRADWSRVEETLAPHGVRCELVFTHWLGKARTDHHFIDLIFSGGNGLVDVDDDWLRHGVPSVILEVPVHLVAAEEMIWSKAFVMERERFDGADITHILRQSGTTIDWVRLIQRFDPHAALLLSHLILFQFAYPAHKSNVPDWVLDELWQRSRRVDALPERLCRGTLISREQYLPDVEQWGYLDAREMPHGRMTRQQIQDWTAAISKDKK